MPFLLLYHQDSEDGCDNDDEDDDDDDDEQGEEEKKEKPKMNQVPIHTCSLIHLVLAYQE